MIKKTARAQIFRDFRYGSRNKYSKWGADGILIKPKLKSRSINSIASILSARASSYCMVYTVFKKYIFYSCLMHIAQITKKSYTI